MENNSSQLTERYKKEVADILRKISEDLGENILKKIEPEISNLNNKLCSINDELEVFKKENISLHKGTVGFFSTELNLVKEDLKGNNTFFSKIEERSLNQDKKIEQIIANGSRVNVLIEIVNKTLETIPEKIRKGNDLSQNKIIEQINSNELSSKVLIENVSKTLNSIPDTIHKGNNLVTKLSQENSKITGEIQKSIDEIILKKVSLISEKLIQIESNSELKHQLKEMQLKQIRIFKFIHLLLFMLIAFFISAVSIFIFHYNQIV